MPNKGYSPYYINIKDLIFQSQLNQYDNPYFLKKKFPEQMRDDSQFCLRSIYFNNKI